MLEENDLSWIRDILRSYDPFGEISPSYLHKLKLEDERNRKKESVRRELDELQNKIMKYDPQELQQLRKNQISEVSEIKHISGIYIIHNCDRHLYYVGQSKNMANRVHQHLIRNEGHPELNEHYLMEEKFTISMIPLAKTSFSSLDDLEDYAIRAYDSLYPCGYNRMPGNIMVKPIFRNEDYQKAAYLIFDDIKEKEGFFSLSNDKKRMSYIRNLFAELNLPQNVSIMLSLKTLIKEYQKASRQKIDNYPNEQKRLLQN